MYGISLPQFLRKNSVNYVLLSKNFTNCYKLIWRKQNLRGSEFLVFPRSEQLYMYIHGDSGGRVNYYLVK